MGSPTGYSPSYGDSLVEDCFSQLRPNGTFRNNVHAALEYVFQIQCQAYQIK